MIYIFIEAVGSGCSLLKTKMKIDTTIEEMYNNISNKLNRDRKIVLFRDYDFENPLLISKKSLKDIYGDIERITFALMTKDWTEREILEKIYYTNNGKKWCRNDNWISENAVYKWDGITIGMKDDLNIDKTDLHFDELSKYISKKVKDLIKVKKLYLTNNNLTGKIIKEIGFLCNLRNLYLDDNLLTGLIPKEIGNLTNLHKLYINNNKISGKIPNEIGNLKKLVELYLYDNQLTGEIPTGICNLTNLKELRLDSNYLYGSIPSGIGNLNNLEYLRSGDKAMVQFEFMFHPEYLEKNSIIVFREGKTKGYGKILDVTNL